MREAVGLLVLGGADVQRHAVAGSHEVGVHEVAADDGAVGLRITDAAAELSGQTFLDLEIHVDQVGRARHRIGLGFDFLDEW